MANYSSGNMIAPLLAAPAFPLKDKVIIVTGAGSPIGKATCIKLSALGARLVMCDSNLHAVNQTSSACHDFPARRNKIRIFNISLSADCYRFVEGVIRDLGQIDHVINCPNIDLTALQNYRFTNEVGYLDQLNNNLKGIVATTYYCLPHLKPGSSFVNVLAAFNLSPGCALYCTAVSGFNRAMAKTFIGKNTVVVSPGTKDVITHEEVFAAPQLVADEVCSLMSGASRVNGQVVQIPVAII